MIRSARAASSDRKSTRLNSSHGYISYAVLCVKKNQRRAASAQPAAGPARTRGGRAPPQRGAALGARPRTRVPRALIPGCFFVATLVFIPPATTEIYTLSLHDALPI